MTLRRRSALGTRKARTQGALVAALRARLRTPHGAAQCGPAADVSFFNSLPVFGSLVLTLALLLGFSLTVSVDPAGALPQWIHDGATTCEICHHPQPPSFQPCVTCHPDPQVPNQKCTQCHTGKTTKGETCWQCHEPGAPQLAPVNENCQVCHGQMPHLGAQLAPGPGCTTCHSTNPTPHHDAEDQVAPTTCTACHTGMQSHNGNDCTACHRTDVHPHFPEVPATCNQCHDANTYNGRPGCLECHFGQPYFGQTDQDIHDESIPDAPISARSCRSCHPQAQKHAGEVPCLECHAQATPFHHGTAASPGFPACETCHGEKFQHGGPLPCTDCHQGAHHEEDPPTPGPAVCNQCHPAETFGTRNCYGCHTPPIFHVDPSVPGCTGCHRGFQIHDKLSSCRSCHTNSLRGHHLTSVVIPGCQSTGCHDQQLHVGKVGCQRCHRNAAHDPTPLNLPQNPWLVCDRCHSFADKVGQPCSDCHDETQHSATYRVPGCTACHEKDRHQKTVDCRLCHTNIGAGHHNDGEVGRRNCSQCHVGAQVHARDSEEGRQLAGEGKGFVCGTCHEGQIHGVLQLPDRERCLECHQEAEMHAGGNQCLVCHGPAVHNATPDAARQGSYTAMTVSLPKPSNGEAAGRDSFTDTGLELLTLAAVAGMLVAGGAALWLWPGRLVGQTIRLRSLGPRGGRRRRKRR